jgi:hypothetical protein
LQYNWLRCSLAVLAALVLCLGCSDDQVQGPAEKTPPPGMESLAFGPCESETDGAEVKGEVVFVSTTNGAVDEVDPNELTGEGIVDFEDISLDNVLFALPAGVNFDGILNSGGARFAERFVGQSRETAMVWDVPHDSLSSTASGPLALQVGEPLRNVGVSDGTSCGPTNVLLTWGPLGYPDIWGAGEGSFAVLFECDQSEFGLRMCGGNGGSVTLNFFNRDGGLITTIMVYGLRDQVLAFRRAGGVKDIAGVSVHNHDIGGIGFDDIRYDVTDCSQGPVGLYLDMHPTSCPNPLNPASQGLTPAAILGTDVTSVMDVNVSSIMLEGIYPVDYAYEDVSTPVVDGESCECTTAGADGYMDLTLKFDTQELVEAIGPVPRNMVVSLTLTGMTLDGRYFEISDCVVIKGKATMARDD